MISNRVILCMSISRCNVFRIWDRRICARHSRLICPNYSSLGMCVSAFRCRLSECNG
jgi:hypothetical protein